MAYTWESQARQYPNKNGGELTGVYCDEVGERAYEASSFRSYDFPKGAAA